MQIDEEEEEREELTQRAKREAEEGRGSNKETHEGQENEEGDDTHHVSRTRARGVNIFVNELGHIPPISYNCAILARMAYLG